jgi:hypothetical protein
MANMENYQDPLDIPVGNFGKVKGEVYYRSTNKLWVHRMTDDPHWVEQGDKMPCWCQFHSLKTRSRKQFKVVSVSSNVNGFGLAGHILVARDGQSLEVGQHRSGINREMAKDEVVEVEMDGFEARFPMEQFGETIVTPLGDAPKDVVAAAWGK